MAEDHHGNDKGRDHQLKLVDYCNWDILEQVSKHKLLISPKLFIQIHEHIWKKQPPIPSTRKRKHAKNLKDEKLRNNGKRNVLTLNNEGNKNVILKQVKSFKTVI